MRTNKILINIEGGVIQSIVNNIEEPILIIVNDLDEREQGGPPMYYVTDYNPDLLFEIEKQINE